MKKFHVISVTTYQSPNLTACLSIIDDQFGIYKYDHTVDGQRAIRLAKGLINPSGGFVILAPDETILLNYFDLCKWIEDQGLRLI